MVIGAWAYKSAKYRMNGLIKDGIVRKSLEIFSIIIIFIIIYSQNNILDRIRLHPVPNLIAPIWAFIAYFFISTKKITVSDNNDDLKDKNKVD